jgi:methionyl-tRNA formyltransferase
MSKRFNIIYMGTPEFAVPALEMLHHSRHEVPLVLTKPDRPCGRGCRELPPPVKQTALKLGLEVYQPEALKGDGIIDHLMRYEPDLFVVVAFGRILPRKLLDLPRCGAINIHASLLPKYRGSAPIQWAIINGEKETGVTTMFMDEGLDTGDLLLKQATEITVEDTAATLHDRLAHMGADLLARTLRCFEQDDVHPIAQDHAQATEAPMLKKDDGRIIWEKPAEAIFDFIRGVTPWPGAFTFHGEKRLKIFKAKPIRREVLDIPGTVVKGFADELRIATGNGTLSILEIQGASGKRMPIGDFLRGYNLEPGTVLK